jgi:hypothetical protein
MKHVDNVMLDKDLFNLYTRLINTNNWNLARSSLPGQDYGTFPGFSIRDNNIIYDQFWDGYFVSLFETINKNFFEKYNYTLPNSIDRIHLGAKNNESYTEFHRDNQENHMTTIVGFLTPVWAKEWGGDLQVEDEKIELKPGRFVIFDSNKIHNGKGPSKNIPYWRISINYRLKYGN